MEFIKTSRELTYIGRVIKIFHPDILEQIASKVKKPVPSLIHYQLLPVILKRFCEMRGVDESELCFSSIGKLPTEFRVLFIAVILRLYNPELLTGIHTGVMKPNLREELSRVLNSNSTWISQQVETIRTKLNPHRDLKAYEEFKATVREIVEALEIEFKER